MAQPTTPHLLVVCFVSGVPSSCVLFSGLDSAAFFPSVHVRCCATAILLRRYPFICKYTVGVARVGCELRRIVCRRFGVAFSPWSAVLGAVRVLWDAPLSTIRSMTLEPAQEGIKVALSAPVEYSADHQARGSRSMPVQCFSWQCLMCYLVDCASYCLGSVAAGGLTWSSCAENGDELTRNAAPTDVRVIPARN